MPRSGSTTRAVGRPAAVSGAPPPPARSGALGFDTRRALADLLPLVDDPSVCDLLIQVSGDGPRVAGAARGSVWVDRGTGLTRRPEWSASVEEVRRLAVDLIAAGGRNLDELHPAADVHLGGGVRVHAILPPVAVAGPAISIRLPRVEPLGFDRLVAGGLCGSRTASALRTALAARQNVLVTGGTGSGKTTLLAALLDLVPHDERIVTIEDVAELRIVHPHRIALEARRPNAEGVGEVTLDDLLREALRMRPDRLIVGECRGAEIATLLAALNTGHEGSAATVHAGSLGGVPARLEALGARAGLDPPTLARQVVAALHLVVHLERGDGGVRRIVGVGRVVMRGERLEIERLA